MSDARLPCQRTRVSSGEHREHGLALHLRREMPVAAAHFLGGVADDVVDNALVHPGRRQRRYERMAEDVESANDGPPFVGFQHALTW